MTGRSAWIRGFRSYVRENVFPTAVNAQIMRHALIAQAQRAVISAVIFPNSGLAELDVEDLVRGNAQFFSNF